MIWEEKVGHIGNRSTFRALVGKREEQISLWKPRYWWEDNITFVLTRDEMRGRGLR